MARLCHFHESGNPEKMIKQRKLYKNLVYNLLKKLDSCFRRNDIGIHATMPRSNDTGNLETMPRL
ncbi:hypothetical protein FLA4_06810 [Candidatus Rickettsia kotlanii]|nr:hypothetical protein FLA4_06810 [Candidatus Rickettsia kotlanii]BDU61514.1 hypothetical protein HM2_06820 [Candidatus Rickettsia kotlanii]